MFDGNRKDKSDFVVLAVCLGMLATVLLASLLTVWVTTP